MTTKYDPKEVVATADGKPLKTVEDLSLEEARLRAELEHAQRRIGELQAELMQAERAVWSGETVPPQGVREHVAGMLYGVGVQSCPYCEAPRRARSRRRPSHLRRCPVGRIIWHWSSDVGREHLVDEAISEALDMAQVSGVKVRMVGYGIVRSDSPVLGFDRAVEGSDRTVLQQWVRDSEAMMRAHDRWAGVDQEIARLRDTEAMLIYGTPGVAYTPELGRMLMASAFLETGSSIPAPPPSRAGVCTHATIEFVDGGGVCATCGLRVMGTADQLAEGFGNIFETGPNLLPPTAFVSTSRFNAIVERGEWPQGPCTHETFDFTDQGPVCATCGAPVQVTVSGD